MPKEKNDIFPLTLAFKSCPGFSATIYKNESTKKDTVYVSYVLVYYHSGKRVRKSFADLSDARAEAERAICLMSQGEASLLDFGRAERELFQSAQSVLARLPDNKVKLDVAVLEYVSAVQLLAGCATVYQAAEFYMRHHSPDRKAITVADAVEKLLEQQQTDKKSDVRLNDLRTHLRHFKKAINAEVATINGSIISEYLSGLQLAERTKANRRSAIAFFNKWLIRHNYLARSVDWLEHVQAYRKTSEEEIEIFTPDELRLILATVSDYAVPYFVIGAFAGIRSAEILRLDWSQINLEGGFIVVHKGQAKKKKRRLPPIPPVLKAWLLPYRKASGPVADFCLPHQLTRLNEVMRWKPNGLRHSFISYRLALDGDIARTAHEAGNSASVIETNYKHAVLAEQAKQWFAVMPQAPANVTVLAQPERAPESSVDSVTAL